MGTRGFTSFKNKLRSAERKIERDSRQIPRKAAATGVTRMKREVIENDAVASTELWRGLGFRRLSPTSVELHSDAPYSGFVEHGTGPNGDGRYPAPRNVPVEDIRQWMIEKPTFVGEPTYWLAWKIAKGIEKHGQRQQPFFEHGFDDAADKTKREMRKTLHQAF